MEKIKFDRNGSTLIYPRERNLGLFHVFLISKRLSENFVAFTMI